MALADYGAFDTSVPLKIFRRCFIGYIERIQSEIIDYLNSSFNFGRTSLEVEYHDFWQVLIETGNIRRIYFEEELNSIQSISQEVNNLIGQRYMDYLGMVTALDPYMCYAADVFSRITDTTWAFGDGQVYTNKYGKTFSDGTKEILRKGLKYRQEKIDGIFLEIKNYLLTDHANHLPADTYGMDRSKFDNEIYLDWKRKNYFLPKIREIETELLEAKQEVLKLLDLVNTLKSSITLWFPESFKLVSYTGLAFNLNKKSQHLANKILSYSNILASSTPPRNVVTTTQIIAVNQAKFWKAKVLPDLSNYGQCLTEAIIHGFYALVYPGLLEYFIDKTWEFIIPKYG